MSPLIIVGEKDFSSILIERGDFDHRCMVVDQSVGRVGNIIDFVHTFPIFHFFQKKTISPTCS